jgi:predicted aminopeptidase
LGAMKKWFKRIGISFLILVVLVCLWQFKLVNYGLMQLRGQLHIVNNTIPIEAYIKDISIPDSLRDKAKLVDDIRRFAFDSLGINFSENYTEIFDQKGKASMFVVTACDPFSFTAKTWNFPIVGNFPYKGFFDQEKAKELAEEIKLKDSLEVSVRTAGGWSTLGWFKDPILSNMLNRTEGDLASLLIHELTHGTLFVKDSVTFNENLASFIGDKGASLYLASKYGLESEEVRRYNTSIEDEEKFKTFILAAAQKLDSTYKNISKLKREEKIIQKEITMEKLWDDYDTLTFKLPVYQSYLRKRQPNNTFFMSYLRYNSQGELLEEELNLQFRGNLKAYLVYLKSKYPSL